ncbi:hypothetical protein EIZ61_05185 [Pseudomonas syringae]|nr:hypothetical protein EIZ61_05185 [Pseudomonas syringae]
MSRRTARTFLRVANGSYLMACSGCEARREWVKKWSKVAYERAQQLLAQPDPGRADEADRAAPADDRATDAADRSDE